MKKNKKNKKVLLTTDSVPMSGYKGIQRHTCTSDSSTMITDFLWFNGEKKSILAFKSICTSVDKDIFFYLMLFYLHKEKSGAELPNHICLYWKSMFVALTVGWLYLYRNNASDALFFVQFYVHANVGFLKKKTSGRKKYISIYSNHMKEFWLWTCRIISS